ncbi:MAG: ParD-like family protein [Pseudomonadales bacterium]|nr:ParD-like family protein [Pseudomonadales bacterium]NRA14844.1 hypothetical protein [Oceanospirillaceae bacterium]
MATNVRLDDSFVIDARVHAEGRSVPKQIEYWSKIGRSMMDNPDLSYEFVRESSLATGEVKQGLTKRSVRRTKQD